MCPEAVARRCFLKGVLLKISQDSPENTCARVSFLIKLQPVTLLKKKRLWHRCFPMNFAKFLRIPHLRWQPLCVFKVACKIQIWKKKHFVKIVTSLVILLFKMTLYMCIYFVFTEKPLFSAFLKLIH